LFNGDARHQNFVVNTNSKKTFITNKKPALSAVKSLRWNRFKVF
jgi:hypothetical protein